MTSPSCRRLRRAASIEAVLDVSFKLKGGTSAAYIGARELIKGLEIVVHNMTLEEVEKYLARIFPDGQTYKSGELESGRPVELLKPTYEHVARDLHDELEKLGIGLKKQAEIQA